MRSRRGRLTAAASIIVVTVLALGACGDDGGSASTTTVKVSTTTTAADGTTTPTTSTTPTTGSSGSGSTGGNAKVESASFAAEFELSACTTSDESTVRLEGTSPDDVVLTVRATDGTGSLSLVGGEGDDRIDVTGKVTSAEVTDDGSLGIEGTYTSGNLTGQSLGISGSCT